MSYNDGDGKETGGPEKERGRAGNGGDAKQEAVASTQERDSTEGGGSQVGYVYFIETEDGRFVKIGYSAQPYRRISQLGTLRPANHALRIIGWMPGTIHTERWIQAKFSTDRDNGEWFRDSPVLRQFIAAIGLVTPPPEVVKPQPAPRISGLVRKDRVAHQHKSLGPLVCDCLRCGHAWVKRVQSRPVRCPKCKQPNWDTRSKGVGRPSVKKAGKKKTKKKVTSAK